MAQYSQYHWFNPKWPGGLSGVFGLIEKIFISHSTCKIIFGVEKNCYLRVQSKSTTKCNYDELIYTTEEFTMKDSDYFMNY